MNNYIFSETFIFQSRKTTFEAKKIIETLFKNKNKILSIEPYLNKKMFLVKYKKL
jgi:hypothetical protein